MAKKPTKRGRKKGDGGGRHQEGAGGGGLQEGDRVRLLVDIPPGQAGQTGMVDTLLGNGEVQVELDPEFGGFLVGPATQDKFQRI